MEVSKLWYLYGIKIGGLVGGNIGVSIVVCFFVGGRWGYWYSSKRLSNSCRVISCTPVKSTSALPEDFWNINGGEDTSRASGAEDDEFGLDEAIQVPKPGASEDMEVEVSPSPLLQVIPRPFFLKQSRNFYVSFHFART